MNVVFASSSVGVHLLRGVLGMLALAAALAGAALLGPLALLGLPVGVVLLRGCPMCWTIGLVQTLARSDAPRGCAVRR